MLHQILGFFDAAFVINLRSRPDRLRDTVYQFRRVGIDVPNDRIELFLTDMPMSPGMFASPGQRGCCTSHMSVLREAEARGLASVLIFEDDIILHKNLLAKYEENFDFVLSQDWDIIHFGYMLPELRTHTSGFFEWKNYVQGAHFYGVRGTTISTLAKYMEECAQRPNGDPAGGATFRDVTERNFRERNDDIRNYLHVPSLAMQSGSRSNLRQGKLWDRAAPTRVIVDLGRSARSWLRDQSVGL